MGVCGIFEISIRLRRKRREVFKGPLRSGVVWAAQQLLMAEFLMKSEPQGPDLMFYKIGDAETRELWRGVFFLGQHQENMFAYD